MAAGFKDRETGYEARYQRDQETLFKITVCRNRLLGLWAAEIMGVSGDAAERYGTEVVVSDFEEVGDADLMRKVLRDLNRKGAPIDEQALRKQLEVFGETARQQIEGEV